ncbi:glycosyltransferase [Streptomyces sp. AJS327]|uniref:glycosyltransferase family 2 protein n=1 Tax=Streptomyces sp. AJS327 TaxID=2545265 RepID=UPI0015DFD6B3|nr:glycosyltransferase [Streptomyces sp. AJS327]
MRVPDVTVIVAVYNGLPYFTRCLESVSGQSIGPDRLELVVVDDGSTDGSGEYAEKFAVDAELPTRVVRQPNSGGPSGPRNVGLSLATGRYVFILDADDHLGPEALERMVAMADRNDTDMVLGRITGVNRRAPRSMFRANAERTSVFENHVLNTMSAEKLFRRELLERHGIRFMEDLHHGEDTCFTLEASLRADGISIVADYPCLYIVGRTDGGNLTSAGSRAEGFLAARTQLELITRLVPPGPNRDTAMVRPFRLKVLRPFGPRLLREPGPVWRENFGLAAPLVEEFLTPGVRRKLKPDERIRLHCVAEHRADVLRDLLTLLSEQPTRRETRLSERDTPLDDG